MAKYLRLKKELNNLTNDPGPGISCWAIDDTLYELKALILGPEDSPYEQGMFTLSIAIPERYPFEPPRVRFDTPIYHPNIDQDGRICLDTLKSQPAGSWAPSINLNTLLLSIRLLMANPNPDDGLMPDITEEYKTNKRLWYEKARALTKKNTESPAQTHEVKNDTDLKLSENNVETVENSDNLKKVIENDDKEIDLLDECSEEDYDDAEDDDEDFDVTLDDETNEQDNMRKRKLPF